MEDMCADDFTYTATSTCRCSTKSELKVFPLRPTQLVAAVGVILYGIKSTTNGRGAKYAGYILTAAATVRVATAMHVSGAFHHKVVPL